MKVDLDGYYSKVSNIVTREIEGELIIVPINSEPCNLDNELFSINPTAYAVWQKIDGQSSLKDIISSIIYDYESNPERIKKDIIEFVQKLLDKKLIANKKN